MIKKLFLISLILFLIGACDNNSEVVPNSPSDQISVGTGIFKFDYQTTNRNIEMNIYYHVPDANINTMPILFVFHGAGRNAVEYRNAWIDEANSREFIVVTPKFSSTDFPGGDGYNLGNVFEDGDNPTLSTINEEQDWAFSIIEPLFDTVKSNLGNVSSTYNIFGFSAGGQFAH